MFKAFRTLFLFLFSLPLWSQSPGGRPFEYIRTVKNKSGGIIAVNFRDSSTNSIIGSVNLHSINPYFYPNARIIDSTIEKNPVYLLPQKANYLNEINLNRPKDHTTNIIKYDSIKVSSHYITSGNSQSFVTIIITQIAEVENKIIGTSSSIYIYDREGILHSKMEHVDADYYYPLITNDGKYLLVGNGQDRSEGRTSYIKPGYALIDTANKKKMLDMDFCCSLGFEAINGKFFMILERLNYEEENIKILDPYSGTIYTKKINLIKDPPLSKVDLNAIYLSNGKKEINYVFKNDFISTKF